MTMLIYTLLAVVLGVLAQTGFGVMVGGYRPVDLTNPSRLEHVTQLALFGIKAIAAERAKAQSTAGNTLETKYSLINITSAKSQIVAGVNYFITIEMQPEECAASTTTAATATAQSSADPLSCELKREECELTIWEQVWLNSTELTNFECTTRRVVNNLGARHRISNDDKSAQHALTFATAELNKFYKQPVYYVAVVQNTYKQVVNGIKYTFEFEYAPTSCLVSEENMAEFKSEEECKVDASKDTMSCVVSVLDQFWLADEETTQSDSSSSQQNDDSNAAAADKKYEVVDKPSRYTLILKNCT